MLCGKKGSFFSCEEHIFVFIYFSFTTKNTTTIIKIALIKKYIDVDISTIILNYIFRSIGIFSKCKRILLISPKTTLLSFNWRDIVFFHQLNY